MPANFKGRQSATLVSEEPVFDASTGVREFDQTFAGSKAAIFAMAQQFEDDGVSYRVTNNGPVYIITARVPQSDPVQENPDRYAIMTESAALSLFQLPDIVADAKDFDGENDPAPPPETYRKVVEDSVEQTRVIDTSTFTPATASAQLNRMLSLVRHLRSGVTGYEEDNLALVRFRQIDNPYAIGTGKFNLRQTGLVYTTAQLQLPSDIAFTLTNLPTGAVSLGRFGWRLRGQRVERIGSSTQQTIHLTYAAWSSLAYPDAPGNLAW